MAGPDRGGQTLALGPYAKQWWELEDSPAAPLDGSLRSLAEEQLARARAAAGAAADSLMLTDAPLMFPPGQLALAAMRAAFRKVPLLVAIVCFLLFALQHLCWSICSEPTAGDHAFAPSFGTVTLSLRKPAVFVHHADQGAVQLLHGTGRGPSQLAAA